MRTLARKIAPLLFLLPGLNASAANTSCGLVFVDPAATSSFDANSIVLGQIDRIRNAAGSKFNFEEANASLSAAAEKDPQLKTAIQMLESEEVELYIFSSDLDSVRKSGILSIHDVGPKLRADRRDLTESVALQLPLQDFAGLPATLKPKYGLLVPKGMKPANPLYGLPYRIKLAEVRDRLTFSIAGDSMNRILGELDLPQIIDEKQISRLPNKVYAADDWSYLFLPWKYRSLLAPALVKGMEQPEFSIPPGWRNPYFPKFKQSREYIEIQIFGEIAPSMIEDVTN